MFRTEIQIPHSNIQLNHKSKIFTIGSCFSNTIGNKLLENKLNTLVNPFGTIFNPISIFDLLSLSIDNYSPEDELYLETNNLWKHYAFHSDFTKNTKEELKNQTESIIQKAHTFIKRTNTIIITLGTSWVYQLKTSGTVVANCHKVPSSHFEKTLLHTHSINEKFETFYKKLKNINPEVNIILTVSPVRHTKDTLQLNSVSKSILRLSCHSITEKYDDVAYFPSYEIMQDDLRDYRFYRKDMIHPNETAIDYIWEYFLNTYTSKKTRDIINDWENVCRSINHKSLNPNSLEHKNFLSETKNKVSKFSNLFDVSKEIEFLTKKINETH